MARIAQKFLGILLLVSAIGGVCVLISIVLIISDRCVFVDQEDTLRELGLSRSEGAAINLGPIELTPPKDSLYRTQSNEASLFQAEALFCDSGSLGFDEDDPVRIKLYDRRWPVSKVLADISDEQVNMQTSQAPSVSSVQDEIILNGLRWSRWTEFWVTNSRIRNVYMVAELPIDIGCCRIGINVGGDDDLSTLKAVMYSIKPAGGG